MVEYSAGMTKKIGLACALIHAPRLLILDEPFEAVDPVSGEGIRSILRNYARSGGTVVMSSHVMELVESLCDELAVVAQGRVLAAGTLDEVRAGSSLQQRFLELVGFMRRGRSHWRGCAPRPAQADPAPQQPAAQRLAHRRPDHRRWCTRLGVVAAVLVGMVALRWTSLELTADVTVLAFPSLTIGWLLMSLLVFGIDETVDPARFALLPVRARRTAARAAGRRPGRRAGRGHRAGRRSGWSSPGRDACR